MKSQNKIYIGLLSCDWLKEGRFSITPTYDSAPESWKKLKRIQSIIANVSVYKFAHLHFYHFISLKLKARIEIIKKLIVCFSWLATHGVDQ